MAGSTGDGNAVVTGLGVAAVAAAIYAVHLPTVAGARASQPGNTHLEASRKSSTWLAAAVVIGATVLGKMGVGTGFAGTVFIMGGATVIGLDFAHRIANNTDNRSGKIIPAAGGGDSTAVPGNGAGPAGS
jgi:hypothetical protein